MDTNVKYPEAKMRLVGEDGNAYSIMGRAAAALRAAGVSKAEIDAYTEQAMSGDYNNLLRVTMQWVSCDIDEPDDDEVCEVCGWDLYECDCEDE